MAQPAGVAAAAPIVADTFTRTVASGWGVAETGGAYTIEGGSGVFSVDGSVGSISLPKAGASRSALLAGPAARDVDIRFRVRAGQPTGGALFVYGVARRNGNNEYRPKILLNPNGTVSTHAGIVVNGGESSLGPQVVVPGLTQSPGTFIWLRAVVTGASPTTIQVKAWADGSAEPATWSFTATNSNAALQGPGTTGLRTYLNTTVTNAPASLAFDDLTVESLDPPPPPPAPEASFTWQQIPDSTAVSFTDTSTGEIDEWLWDFGDGELATDQHSLHDYADAGTYTVTLTATGPGGEDSIDQEVIVVGPPEPPPPPVTIAADRFGRTASGTWRVAETGGLYSYQGTLGNFGVDGAAGTLLLPSAGASRSAFLFSTLALDVDLSFTVSTDKAAAGSSFFVYGALRRATDGSAYRPKIRIAPDGSVYAHVGRYRPTGETSMGPEVRVTGLVHAANTVLRVRAEAIGTNPTTVRVRVWADGQPEPATWHFTATDSTPILQSAGALGVLAYANGGLTNAPLLVRFDDLLATTTEPVDRVTGETFVGAGDISLCTNNYDEATAALLDMIEGTVFTVGDNAQGQATAAEFTNCYDPTWGRHKARTYPAIGNHEYHAAADAAPYFDYFGAVAGERAKGWYAYDVGTWRIYVLNANCGYVGCTPGSEQEQWLRTDLLANPRQCSIGIWHHPRYSSATTHGSTLSTRHFWQALYESGAELVLSGHDHDYERFAPMDANGQLDTANGIRQFVIGTGGGGLRTGFGDTHPQTEVRQATSYGVLNLTLGDTAYEWEFIPIAGQTFSDRGSGTCH